MNPRGAVKAGHRLTRLRCPPPLPPPAVQVIEAGPDRAELARDTESDPGRSPGSMAGLGPLEPSTWSAVMGPS